MKKNGLLILLQIVFFTTLLTAQTKGRISNLDEKNGLKIFKLNSEISLYKNTLEQLPKRKEDSQDLKRYRYNGDCCTDYYGAPITQIILIYYKSKLLSIVMDIDESGINVTIPSMIEGAYGSPTKTENLSNAVLYSWTTKKVNFMYTQFSNAADYIEVYDVKSFEQMNIDQN